MAKENIRIGAQPNDKTGDSLREAFRKVNANFTELYTELGLVNDVTLSLGAFEFAGSTISTTDSTAIVIDQATTVTSNLNVGGDILPQTALGGDLGSSTLPWRSLYVSNNTIYIGGTAVGVDANGNLTVNGGQVNTPSSTLVNGANTVSLGSDGVLTLPGGRIRIGPSLDSDAIIANEDEVFAVVAQGTNGAVQLVWIEDLENAYTSNLAAVYVNSGGPGSVRIATGANSGPGPNHWEFDNSGALTFPQGTTIGTADGGEFLINGAVDKDVYIYTYSGETARGWTFGTDGDLEIPGNIKSEGNINIEINPGDSTLRRWQFGEDGELTFPDGTNQTTAYTGGGGTSIPTVVTTGAVGENGASHAKVQFTVASATTVTAVGVNVIGVTVPANSRITLSGSPATGSFDIVAVTNTFPGEFYILMPFATNASGTGYGAPISGEGTNPCLVRGTMITMADMSRVAVENITYHDDILVWDFDLGEFASAKPIWIKKTQTAVVSCLLTFSDHSELRIVGESPKAHRIFNKEAGKFTYGSMPETPIGTTTFNDRGEEVTLISKEWIVGEVEFYNVMTDYHMNLFANSILTSMRYNNVYPITDMKFVKDSRTLRTADDYPNVEERLYKGFRLAEQTQSIKEIETHIQWLMSLEVERETESI